MTDAGRTAPASVDRLELGNAQRDPNQIGRQIAFAENAAQSLSTANAEYSRRLDALKNLLNQSAGLHQLVNDQAAAKGVQVAAEGSFGSTNLDQSQWLYGMLLTQSSLSGEQRNQTLSSLTAAYGRQQADVLVALMELHIAAIHLMEAEVVQEILQGRLPAHELASDLQRRLEVESLRSQDMLTAILAPSGFFVELQADTLNKIQTAHQQHAADLLNQVQADLVRVGIASPFHASSSFPSSQGSFALAAARAHTSNQSHGSMLNPGAISRELVEWQQLGIIQPGEMNQVVAWIAEGVPPTEDRTTIAGKLRHWAYQRQAVVLTPSVIERLTEAVRSPGGLRCGDTTVTPDNLEAWLAPLDNPLPLLEALGIGVPSLSSVTVYSSDTSTKGGAIGGGGDVTLRHDPGGTFVPEWTVGVAYLNQGHSQRETRVSVTQGLRVVEETLPKLGNPIGVAIGLTGTRSDASANLGLTVNF